MPYIDPKTTIDGWTLLTSLPTMLLMGLAILYKSHREHEEVAWREACRTLQEFELAAFSPEEQASSPVVLLVLMVGSLFAWVLPVVSLGLERPLVHLVIAFGLPLWLCALALLVKWSHQPKGRLRVDEDGVHFTSEDTPPFVVRWKEPYVLTRETAIFAKNSPPQTLWQVVLPDGRAMSFLHATKDADARRANAAAVSRMGAAWRLDPAGATVLERLEQHASGT